jgi:hypothetical protein
MKPHFSDLTKEQQENYGNGCGTRLFKVPDFVFSASCRHHDFIWNRGSETWWKAPYYYTRGNWHFFLLMWKDCYKWWHYPISILYFIGVMLLSWPAFTVGRWRTIEEILEQDAKRKYSESIWS